MKLADWPGGFPSHIVTSCVGGPGRTAAALCQVVLNEMIQVVIQVVQRSSLCFLSPLQLRAIQAELPVK